MLKDLYARLFRKKKPQSGTDPAAQSSCPTGSGSIPTDDLSYAAIAATNVADFGQAEKLCQKLLNDFPYAYDGHECLGYLRACQGHHEEASVHYEKALEKAKEHPEQTSPRLFSYLEAELELQRQIRDSKSMIEDMDRIERDMPANKEKMLPLLSWRWSSDKALKGLPLDLSIHLLKSFRLTIPPELVELRRRQMLAISSIQDSDDAISKARVAREHLQEIVTKCAKISQENFALRGGSSGSLDDEVAAVLSEYKSKSEPVTIDEKEPRGR